MELSELSIAFQPPRYLSPVSAWVEHIPFAFTITKLLRPHKVVELGTHLGDSYCAICQAVNQLELDARCTAVDKWQGDDHSGHYDNTVLQALRAYHDPLYGHFSRLLQASFDQAAAEFDDGSIDLLHLDGLHTRAAVRHDLDTWLPKLSRRGVLLLHDTQVTREGFGVHMVWNELRGRHPSFEFLHGYGLGVAAIGEDAPPEVLRFLKWANANAAVTREFFAALGGRLLLARTIARSEGITRQKGLSEPDDAGINLAAETQRLLDPATDLKDAMDSHAAHMRGHVRRLWRRLQRWSRARRG